MTDFALLQALARGEDSRHQFKRDATNADGMAAELAALANSGGGTVFLGVADDGSISGLDAVDVRRLNQLISNAASQHVRPPLHPQTHNVQTAQGLVLVVSVADGLNKPYMDLQGRVWVKSGADKRHVTAREEMQRMFQRGGLLQADQVPVRNATVADIDERAFGRYFERRYGQSLSATGLPMAQLMENLQLAQCGVPNLAGVLLFGKHPQRLLPVCQIGAVWFPGTHLGDTRYLDSENIDGPLDEQFERGMAFLKRSLHKVQAGRGCKQIRTGVSNRRNQVLAEHAAHILPYRGMGTGVPRALQAWPQIDLVDEPEINQFRAVVWRTVQAAANTSVETSVETPQFPLKTPEAILALLSKQPTMTLSQVANLLGKSTRAIEMAVAKLTESGKLKYVGPKKGGHWEVM